MSSQPLLPAGLSDQLSAWRRQLHAHPEPGRAEEATAAYLAAELRRLGIPFHAGVGGHGLLAVPGGGHETTTGPTVMLRADMDALPIQEENEVAYVSARPGWMHACGHDAHMACLLGAMVLLRDDPPPRGRVVGLFQPAEEVTPGGALDVLAEEILSEYGVGAVCAQHVDHTLDVGQIGVRSGPIMARADEFDIHLTGPGGHTSAPGTVPDPLSAAASVLRSLDESLRTLPEAVAAIGRMEGGNAPNVIASRAVLNGTLRTFDESVAEAARAALEELVADVAATEGTDCEVIWRIGAPPVVNDPELTGACTRSWTQERGGISVVELPSPSLAAEDFGHFTERFAGVYWRLGIRGDSIGGEPWHTPRFDLDERALAIGARALADAAVAILAELAE